MWVISKPAIPAAPVAVPQCPRQSRRRADVRPLGRATLFQLLAQLLGRGVSAGSWGVNVTFGAIVDSINTASDAPPFYKNLVVSAPASGADVGKVVLSGTATAQTAASITHADTYLGTCTGAPGCTSPATSLFTHAAFDGVSGNPPALNMGGLIVAGQEPSRLRVLRRIVVFVGH